MKTRTFTVILILMILLSACNLPISPLSGGTPQPPTDTTNPLPGDTAVPLPSDTPNLVPSDTPTITLTATDTLTPTSEVAMVTPKTEAANCRFGPGTSYISVGGLKVGASVPILGTNGDGTWWQIQNPNNISDRCWVSVSVTDASGNMGSVPVTPAPQPFVTKVTANTPANISVPGCIDPITPMALTGSIDVNGPTAVVWHFETQQGGALPSHTLTFTKYGPQTVTESSYTPPLVAGTYWVRLFITSPNSLKGEANYTIACP